MEHLETNANMFILQVFSQVASPALTHTAHHASPWLPSQGFQVWLANHPLCASLTLFPRSKRKPGDEPGYLVRGVQCGGAMMNPQAPAHLCISCRAAGLRCSCCRGHLAAWPQLLGLLSLWTCKSSITHMPLGFFSWSGVFSSAWMVLLGSHWPARLRGLPAGTSPGLQQQDGGLGVSCSTSRGCSRADCPSSLWRMLFAVVCNLSTKKQR